MYVICWPVLLHADACAIHTHRFQLIYAVGGQMQLPALPERVAAVQALLHAVHTLATAGGAAAAAATAHGAGPLDPSVGVLSPPRMDGGAGGGLRAGGWCGLRLLPGEALDSQLPELLRTVVEGVFERPPYHLRWLQDHPNKVRSASKEEHVSAGRGLSSCLSYACVPVPGARSGGVEPRKALPSVQQSSRKTICIPIATQLGALVSPRWLMACACRQPSCAS